MMADRRWVKLGLILIAPLALFYLAFGFYTLVFDVKFSYPIDLRLRWIEHRFMAEGLNPQVMGHPDKAVAAKHGSMISAGGSYPPWSYATGMLLVPPFDWHWTRCYFAALNALALGFVGIRAYRQGVRIGRIEAWICVCSLFAMFSLAVCLSYGQYSFIIFALLAGCATLVTREHRVLAGLLLGIALVKPHLVGLFALALLVRREFRVLAAAGVYLVASSCVTWAVTGADPLSMIQATSKESELYGFLSQNHLSLLFQNWLGFHRGMLALSCSGAALCVLVIKLLGKAASLETVFAACAVITMFWTYRKDYDVLLLGFALSSLMLSALQTRRLWPVIIALVFAGTLWIPIRGTTHHWPVIQISLAAIWISGLVEIIAKERRGPLHREVGDKLIVDEK